MKNLMVVVLMGASWTLGGPTAVAQNTPSQEGTTHVIKDQDLKLLRQDLRTKRKQLIAANLTLTDTEATKFWPVYDQYVTELIAVNNQKFGSGTLRCGATKDCPSGRAGDVLLLRVSGMIGQPRPVTFRPILANGLSGDTLLFGHSQAPAFSTRRGFGYHVFSGTWQSP